VSLPSSWTTLCIHNQLRTLVYVYRTMFTSLILFIVFCYLHSEYITMVALYGKVFTLYIIICVHTDYVVNCGVYVPYETWSNTVATGTFPAKCIGLCTLNIAIIKSRIINGVIHCIQCIRSSFLIQKRAYCCSMTHCTECISQCFIR
jgi:hypothetical protein